MNLKRTMSQALHVSNLSEEAAAFVAAGAAGGPSVPSPGEPAIQPGAVAKPSVVSEREQENAAFVHSPLPAERQAPVSMTFRLPTELPAALLRVAMERKLRREEPFTQQDIVAEALREWLERNGG